MDWEGMMPKKISIIGLKVVAIRGSKKRKNAAHVDPEYIVFGDGKTFISLTDQDYYDFHDCSSSAKEISIDRDGKWWSRIMGSGYGDADLDDL